MSNSTSTTEGIDMEYIFDLVGRVVNKAANLKVPHGDSRVWQIVLGVANFYFFGTGTAIAGLMQKDLSHSIIGLLQLFIPFGGWFWSYIWGFKMIYRGLSVIYHRKM